MCPHALLRLPEVLQDINHHYGGRMSESTPPPDSTRTLFELQRLSAEVDELNILLDDSSTIIRSLFQLLRDHNIPVGSTELIKARERVEAEMQTLRTANAGLVEKVKRLEEAGDRMAIYAELGGVPLKFVGVVNAWREAKGQA